MTIRKTTIVTPNDRREEIYIDEEAFNKYREEGRPIYDSKNLARVASPTIMEVAIDNEDTGPERHFVDKEKYEELIVKGINKFIAIAQTKVDPPFNLETIDDTPKSSTMVGSVCLNSEVWIDTAYHS